MCRNKTNIDDEVSEVQCQCTNKPLCNKGRLPSKFLSEEPELENFVAKMKPIEFVVVLMVQWFGVKIY